MESILIAYSPQGKQLAASIQLALKSAGYKSQLGADAAGLEKGLPKITVAVIDSDSNTDPGMIAVLDQCERRRINVVPYVAASLEKSLTSNFFLDEHVWIDAAGRNQKDAMDDLVDCLKNNFGVLSSRAEKKSDARKAKAAPAPKHQPAKAAPESEKEKRYKSLFFISLAVIAVMLFVLLSGGVKQVNREAANQLANQSNAAKNSNIEIRLGQSLRKSEGALVGRWVLSGYSDNQYKATRDDSLEVENLASQLINKAQLVFTAEKTFQRIGFSQEAEKGSWEYDPQSKYLKLQPAGVNQYDVVQVQEISGNTLVIAVQENVNGVTVLTKMTFTKIANQ